MIYLFVLIILSNLLRTIHSATHRKVVEQFSSDSQKGEVIDGWKEKSFVGLTRYHIVEEGGNHVLHARADSASSGLFKKVRFDPEDWPYLSWRWKVTRMPEKGDERYKKTDDYGARVYVVFPRFLWWKSKTISYIWARHLPKEASCPNPWLPKNEMMLAVESGKDSLGFWLVEKRNVYEDFRKLFGTELFKSK